MKTTTQTEIKPASFGSISHGTLRDVDLLNAFASELEWQLRRNGNYFSMPEHFNERDRLNGIVNDAWDCFDESGDNLDTAKEESGEVSEIINETLFDALQLFAPAYGYFGAHEGDGSDFGYWVNIDDVKERVGFVSSREQDYPPDDYRGEWLHVNDHGNCTLYVRDEQGNDREIWAIV